jgi:calnexin
MVADPDSAPPEDWDVEEDGDWVAPMVPNPKCADVSGCGPWTRPMMKNPAYKGKWTPEYIDNPAYKGVWAPRKIANPNYFEDKTPANLEPMGAIGYELWSMSSDMLFDNIYIGHSVEDALKLKAETYDIKKPIEEALEKEAAPKPADTPASPLDLNFMDDPKKYIMDKFEVFMAIAQQSPVDAIKAVPEIAGALAVGIITVLAILLSALGVGASSPQVQKAGKDAKKAVVDAKDKAVDAATSAVDSAKDSAGKRQTRSAASE